MVWSINDIILFVDKRSHLIKHVILSDQWHWKLHPRSLEVGILRKPIDEL